MEPSAMVQVIENWAEVEGQIVVVEAAGEGPLVRASLRVDEARDVAGFPNLIVQRRGQVVDLMLPPQVAAGLEAGQRYAFRARYAPRALFVDPAAALKRLP